MSETEAELRAEIARLFEGLEMVRKARCCGCGIYREIADIYMEGKRAVWHEYGIGEPEYKHVDRVP